MLLWWPPRCHDGGGGGEPIGPPEPPPDTTYQPYKPTDEVYVRDTMLHVKYMRRHIGVPPKDTINMWLASVGLGPGNPFCSATLSHSLDVAGVKEPSVRSGLARNFVYQTPKILHIKAEDVYMGFITVPAGSIVVYQKGDTPFGHNGFATEKVNGKSGVYISANTSAPGSAGSESAGGGVYEKPFSINPYAYFRVTDFVRVKY